MACFFCVEVFACTYVQGLGDGFRVLAAARTRKSIPESCLGCVVRTLGISIHLSWGLDFRTPAARAGHCSCFAGCEPQAICQPQAGWRAPGDLAVPTFRELGSRRRFGSRKRAAFGRMGTRVWSIPILAIFALLRLN
jgi:hypothetical protein